MSKDLIPIRLSHLLGQNGVGSIVRGANGLIVVQDIRYWTDRHGIAAGKVIPYVERVRVALGISQELREPPVAKEPSNSNGQVDGICVPASRFPAWARCPGCGALYMRPWQDQQPNNEPRCKNEKCYSFKLEQVNWVLVDPKGYLSDVPWHFLAHKETNVPVQKLCKVRDRLSLIERGHENRRLRCDACGAENQFHGGERLPFGPGRRMQPWTKEDLTPPGEGAEKDYNNLAQILAINDSRVYSPHAESVLVIPPESRVRKGTVVDQLYRNSDGRRKIDTAMTLFKKKSAINELAKEYRCTAANVEAALDDLARGYPLYGENLTSGQLRESEYNAFLEVLPNQRDDEDLVTRNKSQEWHVLGQVAGLGTNLQVRLASIDNLVRVDRLKAVKVFRGFSRLGEENILPPDIVGQLDWLPAIELYGEGIFITIDEGRLHAWEQHPAVISRLQQILPRFAQSGRDSPNPLTSRFLLLHTLSHLLMRQIESEGGYPAASLNERIYCATAPDSMAGILIHVAVPDVAGSLGGLAELAEPRRFLGILTRALDHASWCSLDPVCSEHEGQGPGLLSRAACHACALVPETACEYGNTLLDRCFVKGDPASGLPPFFDMRQS